MGKLNKAVFFDRDGTLNVDIKYLHRVEDFIWIEGAKDAIKYCNDKGYMAIIITNQSGIARGYYDESAVLEVYSWMNKELSKIDAHLDDIFYCPHHIEGVIEKYKKNCECRKPSTGMLEAAIKKHNIERSKSLFIGDTETDMECARNAGIKGARYIDGNLFELLKEVI